MKGPVVHAAGVGAGAAAATLSGAVLGGPWWLVAAVTAGAAFAGRTGVLVQGVATLGLVAGAAGAGETWLVPLLVVGVVATAEAGALVERRTGIGPLRAGGIAVALIAAAAISVAVLWLGDVGPGPAVPLAVLAGAAATAALTVARP